jgi:hypothetical protein
MGRLVDLYFKFKKFKAKKTGHSSPPLKGVVKARNKTLPLSGGAGGGRKNNC